MSSVIALPDALLKNTNKEEQKEPAEFFDKIAKSSSEATILTVEEKFERRLTKKFPSLIKESTNLTKICRKLKSILLNGCLYSGRDRLGY